MTDSDPGTNKALWRFGIISPMLHRGEDDPGLGAMLAALSAKTFIRPGGCHGRNAQRAPPLDGCQNP